MENEQEVVSLWKRYRRAKKTECRDELIVHYLSLVKLVVGRVASSLPSHVKMDDLYSSGVTGLIRAVERFDPGKNTKFESYAMLLIKGAIIDELRKLDWIPRSVHQKANHIAKEGEWLAKELGREPTDTELSHHLGISEEELGLLLSQIRPAILIPLNGVVEGEEEAMPISERIADLHAPNSFEEADKKEYNTFIQNAMSELLPQERDVLYLYYFQELMLKEIGQVLGVSESRVSQIHAKALLRLRGKLKSFKKEFSL